jgi:hypothetical protein
VLASWKEATMSKKKDNPLADPAFAKAYAAWHEASQRLALTLSTKRMYGGETEAEDRDGKLWRFHFEPADVDEDDI